MDRTSQIFCFLFGLLTATFAMSIPVPENKINTTQTNNTKTTLKESPEISPIVVDSPPSTDLSEFEEIKEEEIPDGAVVLMVEETLGEHPDGEIMDTASNVAFRPLFRYRQKQTQTFSNRRIRRRYYTPRRSYRESYPYYRPYRSISRRYSRPYYFNYYPVLSS